LGILFFLCQHASNGKAHQELTGTNLIFSITQKPTTEQWMSDEVQMMRSSKATV